MPSVLTTQQKNDLKLNISAALMSLKECFNLSSRQIAQRLAVNENYLSRVYNGRGNGSPQLLAGLNLLVELETFKKENEKISAAKRAIQLLTGAPAGENLILNEGISSSKIADARDEAVKYAWKRVRKKRRTT